MDSSPEGGQTAARATTRTPLVLITNQHRALVYDPDDVERAELSMHNDIHQRPSDDGEWVERELGQAHVHLSLHFKSGKCARWVPLEEVAEHPAPERRGGPTGV